MPIRDSSLKEPAAPQVTDSEGPPPPVHRRTLFRKVRPIWRALKPYCIQNRGLFFQGLFFAILLVGSRIAMPWPLRQMMTPWLQNEEVSGVMAPILKIGVIYASLILLLGFADYRLRLSFARFSIAVVRDIRKQIIEGLSFLQMRHFDRSNGDLVTRLVGDSARLKAGLKGFLVHVATNGLMFLGISIVILWIDLRIGFVFFAASACNIGITLAGAGLIFRIAIKQRRKESRLAESISNLNDLPPEEEDDLPVDFNKASGTYEARITRLQGRVTFAAHAILALTLPFALWLGFKGVIEERLLPGDLFLVMIYALMIIGPMVRLTRQGSRSGKILANANRLRALLRQTEKHSSRGQENWKIGDEGIDLRKVRLQTPPPEERRYFGPVSFQVARGESIAVIGPPGSGTSTLLRVMAGKVDYEGKIRSGGAELRKQSRQTIAGQISHSGPDDENTGNTPPTVNLDDQMTRRLFRKAGHQLLWKKIKSSRPGELNPRELSPSERGFLSTLKAVQSNAPLVLLDHPLEDSPGKSALNAALRVILSSLSTSQTILVSLRKPTGLQNFSRIIVMRKGGRISFIGNFASWQEWQATQSRPTA